MMKVRALQLPVILVLLLFSLSSLTAQNCPLIDTLIIPAGDSAVYTFEVFDLVNNDLADPGQAVCNVEIAFVHNHIGNFELSLVSPGLDTVNLIGPNVSTSNISLFFEWQVTFRNDSIEGASPDFPFGDRFNNAINDFTLTPSFPFTGAYFPYQGSLADFNSGPVNGTWQLLAKTFPTITGIPGEITHFKINFCDPTGENCCFADAGRFPAGTDLAVTACAGDAGLDNIPAPDFSGMAPDSARYGYTYVVGQNGLLLDFDSVPRPSQWAPGDYQICGLSYRLDQRDSFPPPDGMLTLDSLRTNLAGPTPLFCGVMMDTCLELSILGRADTVELPPVALCGGDSLRVGDSLIVSSGFYEISIPRTNSCDSLVRVSVSAGASSRDTITESSCRLNFVSATGDTLNATGFYTYTYTAASGCDSVVVVDYTRIQANPSIVASVMDFSCIDSVITLRAGADVPLSDLNLRWEAPPIGAVISTDSLVEVRQAGRYTLQVSFKDTSLGCFPEQQSVILGEDTDPPVATAVATSDLDCAVAEINLDATGSTSAGALSYRWTSVEGHPINNDTVPEPTVSNPGEYILVVEDQNNGCRDTTAVQVGIDTLAPQIMLPTDTILGCDTAGIRLDAMALPAGGNFSYNWQSASGLPVIDGNTAMPLLTYTDTFTVTVRNLDNGCGETASVIVGRDTAAPAVVIAPPAMINCQDQEVELDATASDMGRPVQATWQTVGGNILSGGNNLLARVDRGGLYTLTLTDPANGCSNSATVEVMDTSYIPVARITPSDTLDCLVDEIELRNTGSTVGPNVLYFWGDLDNGSFSGLLADRVTVRRPGTYQLIVQDTFTKCIEAANFEVIPDTTRPVVDAGPDRELTCSVQQVELSYSGPDTLPNFSFLWVGPCIIGDPAARSVQVDCAGTYILEVRNENNGCSRRDTVEVTLNPEFPVASVVDSTTIDCRTGLARLDATGSTGGRIEWYYEAMPLSANNDTLSVDRPGRYSLLVVNDTLMCRDSAGVIVGLDCKPEIVLTPPDTLTCARPVVELNAESSRGENLEYRWLGPAPGCIAGDSTASILSVSCAGTYELVLTNTLVGQSDTASIIVFENTQIPEANAGPDQMLGCDPAFLNLTGSTDLPAGGARFFWTNESGDTLARNAGLQVSTAGAYFLTVQDRQNGCLGRDTVQISDPALPDFQIRQPEQLTCALGQVDLEAQLFVPADGLVFSWTSLEGNPIGNPDQPQITVEFAGTYRLIVRDTSNGCETADSIEVIQDTIPPLALAGGDVILPCDQDQLVLSAAGSAMGPGLDYLWIPPRPSALVSGQDSTVAVVRDTGQYLLFILDSGTGCIGEDTVWVLPPPALPAVTLADSFLLDCRQETLRLETGIDPSLPISQRWLGRSPLGDTLLDETGPAVTVLRPGAYRLLLTDTQTACRDTIQFSVQEDKTEPAFSLTGGTLLTCLDTAQQIALSGNLDSQDFSRLWQLPDGSTRSDRDTVSVALPGLVILDVENRINGCSSRDSLLVEQDVERPSVTLAGATQMDCLQDTLLLELTRQSDDLRTQWSGPANSLIDDPGLDQVRIVAPGTFFMTATDTLNGCFVVDSLTVADQRIPPALELNTDDLRITCFDPILLLDATGSQTATDSEPLYLWSGPDVDSEEGLVAVTQGMLLDLTLSDTLNGCTETYTLEIIDDAERPAVEISTEGLLGCSVNGVTLKAQIANFAPQYDLSWSGPEALSLPSDTVITVDQAGTYRLLVRDTLNGCETERVREVVTSDAIPQITILDAGVLDCENDVVEVEVSSRNYELSELTYRWQTPDGEIVGSSTAPILQAGEAGRYYLRVLHEPTSCFVEDSLAVNRIARKINGLEFNIRQNACDAQGGGGINIQEVTGGDAPFVYNLNGGPFEQTRGFTVERAGNYLLGVEDINGCRYDTLVELRIGDYPIPDLGPDRTIQAGDSIELSVQVGPIPAERLTWLRGNTAIGADDTLLTVKPPLTTAYVVRTEDANGCIFEDQLTVFVEEGRLVYQPNVFSPDDDGINDLFAPGFSPRVQRVDVFRVFNRWGQLLYEQREATPNSLELGWDGRFKGEVQPGGVYVYLLEFTLEDGTVRKLGGEVLLLR